MIKLKIGSKNIDVDGETVRADTVPFLKDDRTFVPIRFVAECLKHNVYWDEASETITITNESDTRFATLEQCALDWAMKYNNLSIGLHKELASNIYKDGDGYFYGQIAVGTSNSSVPCGKASGRVAVIHSHASTGNGTQKADKISSSDISLATKWKCDNFMASPCGTLSVYRYKTKNIEEISNKIPYDRRAISKLETKWGYGDMTKNDKFFDEYGVTTVSLEADCYNYLFLNKLQFPITEE